MKNTASKRGYTLYELLITIGVLTIITGIVFTFISTMSTYSRKTTEITDRLELFYDFRSETDYWFSIFDSQEYTLNTDSITFGTNVTATNNNTSETYSISFIWVIGDTSSYLAAYFTYPQSNFHDREVKIELDGVKAVYFFGANEVYEYPNSVILNFTVTQRIKGDLYNCLLVA